MARRLYERGEYAQLYRGEEAGVEEDAVSKEEGVGATEQAARSILGELACRRAMFLALENLERRVNAVGREVMGVFTWETYNFHAKYPVGQRDVGSWGKR